MDDAPYTGDLNLGAVSTRDDLAAQLRTVHVRADKPSLRTLESRTRHTTSPLSKTVVAEMLKGMRFPRKAVMVAFLRACGIQDDDMDPWLRTWERIAASEEAPIRLGTVQTAPGRRPDLYRDTNSPSLVPGDATAARRTRGRDADRSVRGTSGSAEQTGIRKLREQLDQSVKTTKSSGPKLPRRGSLLRRNPPPPVRPPATERGALLFACVNREHR